MIAKIYGSSKCCKCQTAKKEYSQAEYFDVDKMTYIEKVALRDFIKSQLTKATVDYPICFDENDRLVL